MYTAEKQKVIEMCFTTVIVVDGGDGKQPRSALQLFLFGTI
jgi:hypothetical protein